MGRYLQLLQGLGCLPLTLTNQWTKDFFWVQMLKLMRQSNSCDPTRFVVLHGDRVICVPAACFFRYTWEQRKIAYYQLKRKKRFPTTKQDGAFGIFPTHRSRSCVVIASCDRQPKQQGSLFIPPITGSVLGRKASHRIRWNRTWVQMTRLQLFSCWLCPSTADFGDFTSQRIKCCFIFFSRNPARCFSSFQAKIWAATLRGHKPDLTDNGDSPALKCGIQVAENSQIDCSERCWVFSYHFAWSRIIKTFRNGERRLFWTSISGRSQSFRGGSGTWQITFQYKLRFPCPYCKILYSKIVMNFYGQNSAEAWIIPGVGNVFLIISCAGSDGLFQL